MPSPRTSLAADARPARSMVDFLRYYRSNATTLHLAALGRPTQSTRVAWGRSPRVRRGTTRTLAPV